MVPSCNVTLSAFGRGSRNVSVPPSTSRAAKFREVTGARDPSGPHSSDSTIFSWPSVSSRLGPSATVNNSNTNGRTTVVSLFRLHMLFLQPRWYSKSHREWWIHIIWYIWRCTTFPRLRDPFVWLTPWGSRREPHGRCRDVTGPSAERAPFHNTPHVHSHTHT